jgi:UDP-N-acetylmuramoyl-tripeptide--D-alanyl-D-alanine ligase
VELLQNIETSGRRVVLLGDMCDLGNEAVVLHRRAAEDAVTIGRADMLIACGRYASQMVEAARRIGLPPTDAIASDVRSAIEIIRQHLTPGDVLLIKGSRVMALERVMRTLEETSSRVGQTFLSAEARTTDGRQECLPHQDAQLVDARYSVA